MDFIKRNLIRIHRKLGRYLHEESIPHLNNINPIQAYYTTKESPFYIEAETEHCISNYWMPLANHNNHPFVATCKQIIKNPSIHYKGTVLFEYASKLEKTLLIKDLTEFKDNSVIGDLLLFAFTFPWEVLTPQQNVERLKQWIDKEELERKSGLSYLDGMIGFTAVSENKIEKEVNLLRSLILSIQSNGYLKSKVNPITACLLTNDTKYKFLIHGGNHRAAVLTALGFSKVPIMIKNSRLPARVHFSDLPFWPNVINGNFSCQEADNIFKKVFE